MSLVFRTRLRRLSNASGGGGGGTPGGSNGQIQYNNAGAFGGLTSTGTGSVARAGSPAFTGTPTAPTAAAADNTTQLATTAFVQQEISGIVQVLAGEVANFAALPAAASHTGENYLVRQSQGVYFVNRKPAGIYTSDGVDWNYDGDATEAYFQDTLAWTNITSKPSTFAPSAHAASHTNGTDDIQNATSAQKGLATAAQITKLDAIEAGADVTDAGNVAFAIHGATGKATPVDADEIGLLDSAASFALKVLTWANLKATLKTYFDTLYLALVAPGTSGNVLTSNGSAWTSAAPTGGSATDTFISPTQLAADTDNWNPTSLSTATVIRVDTDASLRYLSSITAPGGGVSQRLRLCNISANTLILKDQVAELGTAANRLILSGYDVGLFPGDAIDLIYDVTSARWRAADPVAKLIPPRKFGSWMSHVGFPAAPSSTGAAYAFNLASASSGTGATAVVAAADSNCVLQFMACSTGTTSTGRASLSGAVAQFLLGNNWYWRFSSRVRVSALSDATDTYTVRIGWGDSVSGEMTDGVFLRYTHGTNSGNFELVLRSNSSETAVNCSAGFASNTFCDVVITVTPTRVEAYKDGVLIGSTTTMTNLPSGAGRTCGIVTGVIKSVGTTSRTLSVCSIETLGYIGVP